MMMKKRKSKYRSIQEIKLARERLKYESMLQQEKMKNSSRRLFSSFTYSLRNLSFNIRNRLVTYSFIRSLYKTNILFDFMRNFVRGFRRSG